MKYGLYSVHDAKTGFLTPTIDLNDGSASRSFESATQQVDSLFYTHAADYALYRIGEYDTDNGLVTPLVPPQIIVRASDFGKE